MNDTPSRGRGTELLNEALGVGDTSLPESLERLRVSVNAAMEEILTFGGRVRPLSIGGDLNGYIRGLYASEKTWINRMFSDSMSRMYEMIFASTTLNKEQVDRLSTLELRRLLFLVHKFSRFDIELFPWIYPFSSTSTSDRLWACKTHPPNTIRIPNGSFTPLAPCELYQHWSYMASLREDSKENFRLLSSSSMIVRAFVGKQAQQLSSEIQTIGKSLMSNVSAPWLDMGIIQEDFDPEDGWGHAHQDQSLDGLMREFNGMLNNDKHEQLMTAIREKNQRDAEAQREGIRSLKGRFEGITSSEKIVSAEEIKRRDSERIKRAQEEKEQAFKNRINMLDKMSMESPEERAKRVWEIEL